VGGEDRGRAPRMDMDVLGRLRGRGAIYGSREGSGGCRDEEEDDLFGSVGSAVSAEVFVDREGERSDGGD